MIGYALQFLAGMAGAYVLYWASSRALGWYLSRSSGLVATLKAKRRLFAGLALVQAGWFAYGLTLLPGLWALLLPAFSAACFAYGVRQLYMIHKILRSPFLYLLAIRYDLKG